MKERIRQIQELQRMSQREFAAALGISPSSLSSIYNGHTSPTNNQVQAIHRRFPEINTDWLLFGDGDMVRTSQDSQTGSSGDDDESEGVRSADSPASQAISNPDGDSIQHPVSESALPNQVIIRETVKYVDKPQRKITEIRVFYDDGTFDTFSGSR